MEDSPSTLAEAADGLEAVRGNPYTPGKLAGVALIGATTSLILYTVFQNLDPELRRSVRQGVVDAARGQMRSWFEES